MVLWELLVGKETQVKLATSQQVRKKDLCKTCKGVVSLKSQPWAHAGHGENFLMCIWALHQVDTTLCGKVSSQRIIHTGRTQMQ